MRLILRFLCFTLVNVSLFAMVLVIWLWIRSYSGADGAYTENPRSQQQRMVQWQFISHEGAMWLARMDISLWYFPGRAVQFAAGDTPDRAMDAGLPAQLRPVGKFDLRRIRIDDRRDRGWWLCALPHWLAVVVLAHLPAAAVWSAYRRRRRGLCHHCGLKRAGEYCRKCGAVDRSLGGAAAGWAARLIVGLSCVCMVLAACAWRLSGFVTQEVGLTITPSSISPVGQIPAFHTFELATTRGGIELVRAHSMPIHKAESSSRWSARLACLAQPPRRPAVINPVFNAAGLSVSRGGTRVSTPRSTTLAVPYWLLLLLFAVIPVLYLRARMRERRQRTRRLRGLCEKCGYDLRASSGVCPECGHAPCPA